MRTNVSILIPWRTDHGIRKRIFHRLYPYWKSSGLEICIGEHEGPEPFNISKALNRARLKASGNILVSIGADHIPEPDYISSAASATQKWAILYDQRVKLTRKATESVLSGEDPYAEWPTCNPGPATGIIAVSADLWDDLGGRDETFTGYGGEDLAYKYLLETMIGPRTKPNRVVRDLYHPQSTRSREANSRLSDYTAARGKKHDMRRLIRVHQRSRNATTARIRRPG